MKVICPLMSLHVDGAGLTSCLEGCCALWDPIRLECAFLSISEELQDLKAEVKQNRISEALKEDK